MFHCPEVDGNGNYLIKWAAKLGMCAYNKRESASLIVGLISIACFAFAQFPQIWQNFKLRRLPGLSPIFIMMWLGGDICNLIGCIMSQQLPTQLYQSIYFVIVDCVSVASIIWIWYISRNSRNAEIVTLSDDDESESDNLLGEHQREQYQPPLLAVLPIMFLGNTSFVNKPSLNNTRLLNDSLLKDLGSPIKIAGYVMGWISTVCYTWSRVPQIMKNRRRKSTDGVSLWMFCCTTLGNILYIISLALMFVNWDAIVLHLPWFLGALLPLGLDVVILSQFLHYRGGHLPYDP